MSLADDFVKKTGKTGFYNIMPIKNLPSVLKYGILSYDEVVNMPHDSVAMSEIQSRRNNIRVPKARSFTNMPMYILTQETPCFTKGRTRIFAF